MSVERCFAEICFIALESSGSKIFGFAEFLAGLAMMVLVWTIVDVRYRFRVKTAPIPLEKVTFYIVSFVGVLALLTDLWRAEQWLVPKGNILTPATWQAFLAALFLFTFLTWAWFAFVNPAKFSRWNAARYANVLQQFILKGVNHDLAVIADELCLSARNIVHYATYDKDSQKTPDIVEKYANSVLWLIADYKFCKAVVEESPDLIFHIFDEMNKMKKYGIDVRVFGKNIVTAAIENKSSFIYTETDEYDSGLLGYTKPISSALFANFLIVNKVGTLLTPDTDKRSAWDIDQWDAFCRCLLIAFKGYINVCDAIDNPKAFHFTKLTIYSAFRDLHKLNALTEIERSDEHLLKIESVLRLIEDIITIADESDIPEEIAAYIDDYFAEIIFELIDQASRVQRPRAVCKIVHNCIWDNTFNSSTFHSEIGRRIIYSVQLKIHNKISRLKTNPDLDSTRILGFCLNIMGFRFQPPEPYGELWREFHYAVIDWVKQNIASIIAKYPSFEKECFVDGMSYDSAKARLVFTYPSSAKSEKDGYEYLEVISANTGSSSNSFLGKVSGFFQVFKSQK